MKELLYVCQSDSVMFSQEHELGTIFFDILSLPVSLSPEFQNQESAVTL